MEYSKLLDIASDLGYGLAMSGAETFRVEESISRVLAAYDIEAEVFVIPNCMHISIEPVIGRPQTRMRRIGSHGNDLDAVERYSNLSRRICAERPAPEIAAQWLTEAKAQTRRYTMLWYLVGNALSAIGFALLFGGSFVDCILSGVCGLIVGMVQKWMEKLGGNPFFVTIAASFLMSLFAYITNAYFPSVRSDVVIIGGLMLLVPGLLITNAMRDIIYGDTNSGINRLVQVLLTAAAIALGAAAAWNVTKIFWGVPVSPAPIPHGIILQTLGAAIGCFGFSYLFNIYGKNILICTLGGTLAWIVYALCLKFGWGELVGYFWASFSVSIFAEVFARIHKCPATAYLVISIFPLIPGSGVYYTMEHAVKGEMELFASKGMFTAAIAGTIAVGILLISTAFRLWSTRKQQKNLK